MIFRQLFEPASSTYTYLFGFPDSGEALLLDPVLETVERDLAAVQELGLRLRFTLETHIHADHVTGACRLRSLTGCKVAYPAMDGLPCADLGVSEVDPLTLGGVTFRPLFTPGHTESHHSYLVSLPDVERVFTGDALLIDGCGRTDFQGGDASTLYRSIHEKIFSLPADTLVYPAHDYQHRHVTTVGQEKRRNPRLGGGRSIAEFEQIMAQLDLPYPERIDVAVPANRLCGDCPEENLIRLAESDGPSFQG
jgi:sulfur dioxygenase